ncbi:Uma2 family endonuclease [Roseomonas sp. KE0001]|uniref:Uma2 family endonuclease n=1 Tax=Roseomonas sp. KE0001 TaxID=2479201 RepID=UPI0018DF56DD|nr:Uma2 family endonuclease [Roseomonas sp. KE0001]MBI0436176.1 Uma2 family endonuclease [Roseomonas sp. KE0001]
MNVAFRKPMSLQEFLIWEEGQGQRFEFDGFHPVAMTGGTEAHSTLQANLAISVGGRLRGKPCRFHGSDLKVEVAGSIRYPDGFVLCSSPDPRRTVVRDPVVIFEVLSNSTASIDRITKNHEYAATPSIQRYIMLEQDRIGATVFSRAGDDWVGHILKEDAVLHMPEIGIDVPIAELYEGLDFSQPADAAPEGPIE